LQPGGHRFDPGQLHQIFFGCEMAMKEFLKDVAEFLLVVGLAVLRIGGVGSGWRKDEARRLPHCSARISGGDGADWKYF
jgi:hypothetical protein